MFVAKEGLKKWASKKEDHLWSTAFWKTSWNLCTFQLSRELLDPPASHTALFLPPQNGGGTESQQSLFFALSCTQETPDIGDWGVYSDSYFLTVWLDSSTTAYLCSPLKYSWGGLHICVAQKHSEFGRLQIEAGIIVLQMHTRLYPNTMMVKAF